MKKLIAILLVLVMALSLFACAGSKDPSEPGNDPAKSEDNNTSDTPSESGEKANIVLVIPNSLGVKAFSDMVWSGVQIAKGQNPDRIGNIECEAQQRAAKLEADTQAQLRRMADSFRAQYEALTGTFDAAAAHVTAELRKVEVNLSQLPRSLDPVSRDLEKLDGILDGKPPQ